MTKTARKLATASLATLSLIGVALAATSSVKFYINGQKNALDAIVVNGRAYVPVSALKAAGLDISATASAVNLKLAAAGTGAGGSNQVAGVSGCIGQTLFNGVWRFKVVDVKAVANTFYNKPGWEITAELRNGTNRQLALTDTGFLSENLSIAFQDGTTAQLEAWASNNAGWDYNKTILPAAVYNVKAQIKADAQSAGQMPTKLVYQRAGNMKSDLPWNTPDPSFRVDLTCRK